METQAKAFLARLKPSQREELTSRATDIWEATAQKSGIQRLGVSSAKSLISGDDRCQWEHASTAVAVATAPMSVKAAAVTKFLLAVLPAIRAGEVAVEICIQTLGIRKLAPEKYSVRRPEEVTTNTTPKTLDVGKPSPVRAPYGLPPERRLRTTKSVARRLAYITELDVTARSSLDKSQTPPTTITWSPRHLLGRWLGWVVKRWRMPCVLRCEL